MGCYSNDCLSCFSGTGSQRLSSLSWVRGTQVMGTLTLKLGPCKCPMNDLLTSEGPKLHPQIMLTWLFSEHAFHEEVCNSDTPAQNTDYLIFFLPPNSFAYTSDHPASLNIPCSLPSGRQIWDLVSSLGCLVNEFFLSCKSLGVSAFGLLHVGQKNLIPSSVTQVPNLLFDCQDILLREASILKMAILKKKKRWLFWINTITSHRARWRTTSPPPTSGSFILEILAGFDRWPLESLAFSLRILYFFN